MLKIWLNWLQPSLSVLGGILVLSNALSAYAVSKATASFTSKAKAHSQSKVSKPLVTATVAQQRIPSSSIPSATPDVAVRQLATATMAMSDVKSPSVAYANNKNSSGIASFLAPSTGEMRLTSAKSNSAQFVKHSIASSKTHPSGSTSAPLVPGLFIGNSNATKFVDLASAAENPIPTSQPVSPVVAKSITPPMPTASVMASTEVAAPFPVIRPEGIKQLGSTEVATTTAPQPSPTATIASGLAKFLGDESTSIQSDRLDTKVASGLQQFLGDERKGIQTDSLTPVATAIPAKTDSILALGDIGASSPKAASRSGGSSLQLATSQSYDRAVEFDLPGVASQLNAIETPQTIAKVLPAKTTEPNLSATIIPSKSGFTTIATNKSLISQPQQPWATVSQSNNLGGLILGSRSTNEIASLPMNGLKASIANGLSILDSANQY